MAGGVLGDVFPIPEEADIAEGLGGIDLASLGVLEGDLGEEGDMGARAPLGLVLGERRVVVHLRRGGLEEVAHELHLEGAPWRWEVAAQRVVEPLVPLERERLAVSQLQGDVLHQDVEIGPGGGGLGDALSLERELQFVGRELDGDVLVRELRGAPGALAVPGDAVLARGELLGRELPAHEGLLIEAREQLERRLPDDVEFVAQRVDDLDLFLFRGEAEVVGADRRGKGAGRKDCDVFPPRVTSLNSVTPKFPGRSRFTRSSPEESATRD
ncbi:hypothetical protein ACN28S_36735 [Cystobacter fuscus]